MIYHLDGFKPPKEPEPELHVYLEAVDAGGVNLMGKAKDGIPYFIAKLTKEGNLQLYSNVPTHFKLNLQVDGCIRVTKSA